MIGVITLAMVWLAAAQGGHPYGTVRSGGTAGGSLLSNAVTVEGTATVEVAADSAKLEFVISADGATAANALANLKPVREEFKKAIAPTTGLKAAAEFELPQVTRRNDKEAGAGRFGAYQKAVARLDYLPGDKRDLEDYLTRLTSIIADAGVIAPGVPMPAVTFIVSAPQTLENDLISEALKNAKQRAERVARATKLRVGDLRSAYFPSTVSIDARTVPIAEGHVIESRTATVTIEYTVQAAYALNP